MPLRSSPHDLHAVAACLLAAPQEQFHAVPTMAAFGTWEPWWRRRSCLHLCAAKDWDSGASFRKRLAVARSFRLFLCHEGFGNLPVLETCLVLRDFWNVFRADYLVLETCLQLLIPGTCLADCLFWKPAWLRDFRVLAAYLVLETCLQLRLLAQAWRVS